MPFHAFVDESYRSDYLLCAAVLNSATVAEARRQMSVLPRQGQSRIHMAKESDGRRKSLLTKIASLRVTTEIVTIRVRGRSLRSARDAAFSELTGQLLEMAVDRMIIESCDQDKQDRQVIGDELSRLDSTGRLEVLHLRPHDEPLLWIPDAVAWAYGKKGEEWRRLLSPILGKVTRLQ